MQTEKDAEIVGWVGRVGAAGAEDVMARFGMGRSWAYARLGRLVRDGLLEQKTLLYRRSGVVCGERGRVALVWP
jgi:DNA-binding IclR family transcriptional regulator